MRSQLISDCGHEPTNFLLFLSHIKETSETIYERFYYDYIIAYQLFTSVFSNTSFKSLDYLMQNAKLLPVMNELNKDIPTSTSEPLPANGQKGKRERSPLTKVLPTDRLAFEKQREVLRAFAAEFAANGNQPVSTDKAGLVVALSGSTISQAIAFFCDIGLLLRSDKGGFFPSPELIDYNNSCQWDETEARSKLRPIFDRTWFYRCLIPRLQLASQSQATCLAILSGESKASQEHQERLIYLLNFLELSSIISISGGTVTLAQQRPSVFGPQEKPKSPETVFSKNTPSEFSDQEEHSLFLDKDKTKKFTINSPLFISRADYERICKWIEVTLIIERPEKDSSN